MFTKKLVHDFATIDCMSGIYIYMHIYIYIIEIDIYICYIYILPTLTTLPTWYMIFVSENEKGLTLLIARENGAAMGSYGSNSLDFLVMTFTLRHGYYDGPNRNRWFTYLLIAWCIFPWRTGNVITRWYIKLQYQFWKSGLLGRLWDRSENQYSDMIIYDLVFGGPKIFMQISIRKAESKNHQLVCLGAQIMEYHIPQYIINHYIHIRIV